MSGSRWASLIGLLGSLGAVLTSTANILPPKYAVIIAGLGAALAAFNERVHGGLSTIEPGDRKQ